jgi:hypothetical protein
LTNSIANSAKKKEKRKKKERMIPNLRYVRPDLARFNINLDRLDMIGQWAAWLIEIVP